MLKLWKGQKGEGKFFSLCLLLGQILSANPKFLIGNTLQEGLTSPSQKYLFRIGKGTRQGGGKVNFFVYEWICVWKRGKVLFKGFYDKNTVKKGHILCFFMLQRCFCFGWSISPPLTSPSSKCLFGLGEATKQGGAKLTFLFIDGFEWEKGKICLELSPNLKF